MYTFVISGIICILVIFLGFEIRHRAIVESIDTLTNISNKMYAEILELKAQIKLKKDIVETHNPTIY